jgi:serine/threonine protein phosphatase PrpC
MFAAQAGDGIVTIRRSNGSLNILPMKAKAFQNTTGTVSSQSATDWSTFSETIQPGDAVLMATDGIADDLDAAKIGDFIAHLLTAYLPLPGPIRSARIRAALHKWPTRHHRDDKTFVILTRTS